METFKDLCDEMEEINRNYLKNENKEYLEAMEESWMKLITNGRINFNDFSFLSAFEIEFLKFKIRQYQIKYLKIKENNNRESVQILSEFIIMLNIGIEQTTKKRSDFDF